jgi:CBS domain-containing protein
MVMQYPVKNVMSRHGVRAVQELDTLVSAIHLMDAGDISALPVKGSGGHMVGVLSRTDIASDRFLVLLKEHPPEALLVRQLMNRTPPVCIQDDQPVADAVALMHKRDIHRVFVTNAQQHVIGILSSSDIIKLLFVEK